eukprot:CAMPEP_0197881734 /NCGR_PEP_ID=MMETSP1439-20131203/9124_1 /TAXON_ID=66791 /ORGANISM="Gonyaulax spinifera, Strain CCMP409" /LENGTH=73 /DNA_ID=CAMNT_0043501361 /DNA_START=282 /DNA_END=500 /DNA_ORIENTATION=+
MSLENAHAVFEMCWVPNACIFRMAASAIAYRHGASAIGIFANDQAVREMLCGSKWIIGGIAAEDRASSRGPLP